MKDAGRKIRPEGSLGILHEELVKQWHPTKNGTLTPFNVTSGSGKIVWWQCEKGHEWQAQIHKRAKRGDRCPFCANKRITKENSLAAYYPDLAEEWHPTKNRDLTPEMVAPHTTKRVWWKCEKGHEWQASINSRKKSNCPFCTGRKASDENNFAINYPEIAKEWHPTKNGKLAPTDVTFASGKRVWWFCVKGHEWEATVANRKNGTACPYCSNNKIANDNCLSTMRPDLAKEWHTEKNELSPTEVTPGSNNVVWWKCEKGHEWQAKVLERNRGRGCPNCRETNRFSIIMEKAISRNGSLYERHPKIAKEWNYKRNNNLNPEDVSSAASLRVWWICQKGHEWQNSIYNRTISKNNCPECTKVTRAKTFVSNRIDSNGSLQDNYPELCSEWHPTKNKDLSPDQVLPGMHLKVWWVGPCGHEFQAMIYTRVKGSGCPKCGGSLARKNFIKNKIARGESLGNSYPQLIKEWHEKNEKTPFDYLPGSKSSVWWKCAKGHEWKTVINNRVIGKGCPYCASRIIGLDNNLAVIKPELAKEWHPTKNGDLSPLYLAPSSNRMVWWLCKRGHEWRTSPNNRSKAGCPKCAEEFKTSSQQIALYFYAKQHFENVTHRHQLKIEKKTVEIDVFIEDIMVGIEYDGEYYHRKKKEKDEIKNQLLHEKGLRVIRIRSSKLPELSGDNFEMITIDNESDEKELESVISQVFDFLGINCAPNIDRDRTELRNLIEYVEKEESLLNTFPDIAEQWHPTKNGRLKPEHVSKGSGKKIWWICEKGHEWLTAVNQRTSGGKTNCPYCSNHKVGEDNNLGVTHPHLIKEWHPIKNKLTPFDFVPGSHKKAWWICKKGHEWQTYIYVRVQGKGCPYCASKFPTEENNFGVKFPELIKEWHPTKNGKNTPFDYLSGSNARVWWICSKGHEWEISISQRTGKDKTKCPYCAGQKIGEDNNLAVLFPNIAKEWDPTKNGKAKPETISPGSNKKYWWKCEKGHEWETAPKKRTSGQNCPYCSNKKVNNENSFSCLYPRIAAEWNDYKNNDLKPEKFVYSSHKKVWWACEKGHEWQAEIRDRTLKNQNCPYCSHRRASKEYNLGVINPEFSTEWHPFKNGELRPFDVTPKSHKKVWWRCRHGHEWEASIAHRSGGTNCPYCKG